VLPDEREAGRSAARVLLRHGHRDGIVVVGENTAHVIAAAERLAVPHFELGRRAVEILLSDSRPTEIQRVAMPLRERGSIAGPPLRKRARRARATK
jgi:DNA-binding LacI/PurR family transcriptional regulator